MSAASGSHNHGVDLQGFHRDERGIVVSWLVRILLSIALAGVVLFDVGSIVVNFFSVHDTAQSVAASVTTDLASGGIDAVPNLECVRRLRAPACRRAYAVARDEGVEILSASFDERGRFHVEVRKTAGTVIVGRISAIESWATATASASADTN